MGNGLKYGHGMAEGPIPIEGRFPILSEDDSEANLPETVARPDSKVFYMGDPEKAADHEGTKADFNRVAKLVANERAVWEFRDEQYDEEEKTWRVFGVWIEFVQKDAKAARQEKISI